VKVRTLVISVLAAGAAFLVCLLLGGLKSSVVAQSPPDYPVIDPAPPDYEHIATGLTGLPLMFIENVGQLGTDTRFQVRQGNTAVHLADNAIWFTLREQTSAGAETHQGVNLKLTFPGANPRPRLEPFGRLDTHVSYFIGNDPSTWHTDVPVWGGVRYVDLYPGVDLEITGQSGRWAWRLVCGRRGQLTLRDVRMRVKGAADLTLGDNHLHLITAAGDLALPLLTFNPGVANQTFDVPIVDDAEDEEYEHLTLTLSDAQNAILVTTNTPATLTIVDNDSEPTPTPPSTERLPFYSTFLGGSDDDYGTDVAVDGDGDAYIIGHTSSSNFPASTGAFSETLSGGNDVFVTKIHPADEGTSDRVYATYIGGSAGDAAGGIAVDDDENAYITGWSNSFFPDTNGSFANCDGGGAFVTKLNDTGNGLLYSGCLAGINAEGQDIALDDTGQVYVSGKTGDGFPVTSGAYQDIFGGQTDAFVTIIATDGTTLTYATYVGGDDNECTGSVSGCTLDLDDIGNIYLAGDTESPNFPTKNAYDATCGTDGDCNPASGYRDAFLIKLNPAGNSADDLLYGTFFGGSGGDAAGGVAVGGDGHAYLTGETSSNTDFPTTDGAYSEEHGGGHSDAYLIELNPSVSGAGGLIYATYLGGSANGDKGHDIAVDAEGYAYAVGITNSDNFPTTHDGYDTDLDSATDAFVVTFNPAGNGTDDLLYGTFLGGDNGTEIGYALALDAGSNVYVTGQTTADDFPTSAKPFDDSYNGGTHDGFLVRLPTTKHRIYLPLILRRS
jgi:hypothetical protein